MRRRDLAKRLVSASTSRERRALLREHSGLVDVRLAHEIKELCYSRWTAEPAVARGAAAALSALSSVARNDHVNAISFWIDGIAKITQSKFEQAVDRLDAAARAFSDLRRPVDAAQTQVPKLIALALLGRYDEADEAGRWALVVFEKAGDQLSAGKIEMNLSNVAARREMHREAERYAVSALRRFEKIGERIWQTMAENDIANTYVEINEFRKAEKYFAMAVEGAKAAGMRLTQAEIEASLGNLEMFRGKYSDALRYLELSRRRYEELGLPHQMAIAELEIAEIYAELNLVAESISMLGPLTRKLKELRLKADEARARTIHARMLTRLGDYRSALKELGRARQIFSRENNSIGTARTDILRADVMIRRSELSSAEAAIERAHADLKDRGNKRWRITADWLRAEISRLAGQTSDARALLSSVIRESKSAEMPGVAVAGLTSLGKLELSGGNVNAARAAFRRAVALIESMREPISSDELRMSFLSGQLEPYNELYTIAVANGRVVEAFALHESARARTLLDAVGSGTARKSSGKLAREIARLREELNWFYSRLARSEANGTAHTEAEIERREKDLTKLNRQLESLDGVSRRPSAYFDQKALQRQLADDSAMIEYVDLEDSLAAFIVTDRSIDLVQDLAQTADVRRNLEGLRFQFGTLRFGAAAVENFLPQLKQAADQYLARLHELLIAPFAELIAGKKLVIAPAGVLNYVPFNALYDGQKYLIEVHDVSITPSAGIWTRLNHQRRRVTRPALLIGYSDGSIPLAEAEVRVVEKGFAPEAAVLVGQNATFRNFIAGAPNAGLIHIACHGQFRSDNPMFSSLHLADGWVTVRDIAQKKLKAGLVTLSACETGLNEIHGGEEILGLTRGFLSAGVQDLIVSLWTVNDRSTSELMSELYANMQRCGDPGASLKAAQNTFIARGSHPYYWSSFILIGR